MSRAAKRQSDSVTLSRSRYETLIRRVEDAEDRAALAVQRAREETIGKSAARADHLPVDLVRRMITGESPVRIWREHRKMTSKALAAAAGIVPSYLSEIESGKKPGSFDAMTKLARALDIRMEDLATD
ncbi:MAG: helix-turn-helix transcriptional regulator [Alphaproteobacteria bacterium]|nr:helix-turn-helix transcriptional regulator [Alphaproteobacteria bacterium]